MRVIVQALSALLLVTVLGVSDALAQSLVVHMDTEQTEYVIREPVKFRVALVNMSSEPVNIPEVGDFNNNMKWTYLLLTTPEGKIEKRRYQYIFYTGIVASLYAGELLAPGDSIQFFLYPNLTFKVPMTEYAKLTFAEPGYYDVQVCYAVPAAYKVLKASAPEDVCSSAVTLHFRKPDPVEKDILDAVWKKSSIPMAREETWPLAKFDLEALRSVLRRYPQHPLVRLMRYELARSLAATLTLEGPQKRDVEEAVRIFEALRHDYPNLRRTEIAYDLARAYVTLGRRSDATDVLERAINRNPGLRTDARFMPTYVFVTTGDENAARFWAVRRRVSYQKQEKH